MMKTRKTSLSKFGMLLLTFCLLFTSLGLAPAQGGAKPCPNHAQHDADCGYAEAFAGAPCTHTCETCNPPVKPQGGMINANTKPRIVIITVGDTKAYNGGEWTITQDTYRVSCPSGSYTVTARTSGASAINVVPTTAARDTAMARVNSVISYEVRFEGRLLNDGDMDVEIENGALTIIPSAATLRADDLSLKLSELGGLASLLDASVTGFFSGGAPVKGTDFDLACNPVNPKVGDTFPITIIDKTYGNSNYAVTWTNGTLTIEREDNSYLVNYYAEGGKFDGDQDKAQVAYKCNDPYDASKAPQRADITPPAGKYFIGWAEAAPDLVTQDLNLHAVYADKTLITVRGDSDAITYNGTDQTMPPDQYVIIGIPNSVQYSVEGVTASGATQRDVGVYTDANVVGGAPKVWYRQNIGDPPVDVTYMFDFKFEHGTFTIEPAVTFAASPGTVFLNSPVDLVFTANAPARLAPCSFMAISFQNVTAGTGFGRALDSRDGVTYDPATGKIMVPSALFGQHGSTSPLTPGTYRAKIIFSDGASLHLDFYADFLLVDSRTFSVSASPSSGGAVTGGGTFAEGTSCTLTATPKAGYRFIQWTEGGKSVSKSYRYSFSVSKARTLKAEFAKIGTPSIKAATGYNRITLNWKAVAGAYQYQVYRKAPGEKAYKKIATATKPTYTNKGLKFNKSYFYRVRTVCKAGTVKTYGSYSKTLTVRTVPATPLKVIAKKAGARSLRVSWERILGAQGYQVYCMSKGGGYDKIRSTKNNAFLNTNLTKGRTYSYKVRSWRMDGGKRVYGKFSKVIKVTVK